MARVQVLDPATDQWVWADTSDLDAVNEAWEQSDALIGVHETQEPLVLPSIIKAEKDKKRADAIKIALLIAAAYMVTK